MNVLFLNNELRYTCGVSNHLYDLAMALKQYSDVKVFFATGGGDAIERYTSEGFPVFVPGKFRHHERNNLNFIKAVYQIYRIILSQDIDIVHAHTHYHANIGFYAAKLAGIKSIQTNHGLNYVPGKLPHLRADYFIAINRHIAEYWKENKILDDARYTFIRGGIIDREIRRNKADTRLRIICASRLIEEKGIDTFINAVAQLPQAIKDKCTFLVAGEGEDEAKLRVLNESCGRPVEFIGNIPLLGKYFYTTDILVFPSRSLSEGFPRIITEAAIAGNTIIASRFIGSGYELAGKDESFLFDVDDVAGLTGTIAMVVTDTTETARRTLNGTRQFKERFSLSAMASATVRVYKKVIGD